MLTKYEQNMAFSRLVDMTPRPAAVVDSNGSVIYCNKVFDTKFPMGNNQYWLARVGDTGLLAQAYKNSLSEKKHVGMELPIRVGDIIVPAWCEIYPLWSDATFVSLHNTYMLRKAELLYMHKIRRVPDDNLWLMDTDLRLIWARVTEDIDLAAMLGHSAAGLLEPESRQAFIDAASAAIAEPGIIMACTIRVPGRETAVDADIVYMAGGLYGGRYYVATRPTTPKGFLAVHRMMEAYQVTTYKALAEKVHISRSVISRIAAEDKVPADMLVACADNTGVSLDWLRYGQGKKLR